MYGWIEYMDHEDVGNMYDGKCQALGEFPRDPIKCLYTKSSPKPDETPTSEFSALLEPEDT